MICSGTFEGGKTSLQRRQWRAFGGAAGGRHLYSGRHCQLGPDREPRGRGCEEKAIFSVYTDISHFVPWLNEVLTTNP